MKFFSLLGIVLVLITFFFLIHAPASAPSSIAIFAPRRSKIYVSTWMLHKSGATQL